MKKFTVGHDGELFLRDKVGNFVSAIGLIGGSKGAPIPVPHLGVGYGLQEDNVTVEFNIPACNSAASFVAACSNALSEVNRVAMGLGLEVAIQPSATFDDEQLAHPLAREGGCTPDMNAWSGKENPKPKLADTNLRSAGGHVHIGVQLPPIMLARACDIWLGVPSVLVDKDSDRRSLYGKAGAFRVTPWGMEYRTLSNFWLASPERINWVFQAVSHIVQAVERECARTGGPSAEFLMRQRALIETAINTGDENMASSIMNDYAVASCPR